MILRLGRGEGRVEAFGWRRETSVEEKYREREENGGENCGGRGNKRG